MFVFKLALRVIFRKREACTARHASLLLLQSGQLRL
nr:MAG TPA: hypothetical protein [Caudoviricetes sp.]